MGKARRGLKIIADFSKIVRFNNVRATIKLQFRDVDNFIHKDFRDRTTSVTSRRRATRSCRSEDLATLVQAIRKAGCIPSATPFDEASVDLCEELDLPLIKLASSDINDWFLIERIAKTKKPVIASSGGSSLKDTDDLVTFFANRNIPLALNHCVSLYPTEDRDLELNQIDFLRNRYPDNTIGLSTHEYKDWETASRSRTRKAPARSSGTSISMRMEFRSRHIARSRTSVDVWFKAFRKAKRMCGSPGTMKRRCEVDEIKYLDALVRGVYAKRD